jgi:hypothetical protein
MEALNKVKNDIESAKNRYLSIDSVGVTGNLAMGAGVTAQVSKIVQSKWGEVSIKALGAVFEEGALCKATVSKDSMISISGRDLISTTAEFKVDMFNGDCPFSASLLYNPVQSLSIGCLVQSSGLLASTTEFGPIVKCTIPGPWSPFTLTKVSAAVGRDNFINLEARVTSYFSEEKLGGPSMTFVVSPLRKHEPFSLSFQYNI